MMNSTTVTTVLFLMMWKFTHALPGNSSSLTTTNATSTDDFHPFIVGGSNAPRHGTDFVVGLRQLESSKNVCGGALIAPRVVLTAAHCVASKYRKTIVNIGSKYVDGKGGEDIRVLHQIRHPKWRSFEKQYDIAILILEEPTSFKPIVLDRSSTFRAGTSVRIFGWGFLDENADEMTDDLRQVDLPIVDNEECQENIQRTIHPSMMCAGGRKGEDSCQGDSGGPLVLYELNVPKLVGIVSFGIGCAQANSPGVYSRVEYVHDWILSTMAVFGISME